MAAAPRRRAAPARAPLRFVTAASLFDGHDAAINMIRRLLQARGAEVMHLGHNRSVADIVRAAIQEDADAIAVSSYQGGHNEYFAYMVDMLRERGAEHIRVVVGGGGTIAPEEIEALERHGVEKIYTPEDGRRLGLAGMIEDVFAPHRLGRRSRRTSFARSTLAITAWWRARISVLEGADGAEDAAAEQLRRALGRSRHQAPGDRHHRHGRRRQVEPDRRTAARLTRAFPKAQIAVVAMDPTRRRSGGALLGDRIRMNASPSENVYMRSLATRREHLATAAVLRDVIELYQAGGFDLVLVETAGIGQCDTEIVDLVDLPVYVMTSEYGAASQLEKIDMLDFADFIVLNKFEKRGAEDACVTCASNGGATTRTELSSPTPSCRCTRPSRAASTIRASTGCSRRLCAALAARHIGANVWQLADAGPTEPSARAPLIPGARTRYLAEIAQAGRAARARAEEQCQAARRAYGLYESLKALHDARLPGPLERLSAGSARGARRPMRRGASCAPPTTARSMAIGAEGVAELRAWPERMRSATDATYSYKVRERLVKGENYSESLSHSRIPKLAVPKLRDWGELLQFLLMENLPGAYPYTGGVYPYRREEEDPTRMFAGEGGPERTNRRFHYLAHGHGAARLSTAFDSTTLYGEDPDTRPDVYGRTGNSGVSIATLDDMKKLYSGFDLCSPSTSVSMTINGPAPMLLAMFMNTAIDQQVERYLRAEGRWSAAERRIAALHAAAAASSGVAPPAYKGALPAAPRRLGARAPRGDGRRAPRARGVRAHPRRDARGGARHRAGRHPQGGPGAEHLHLLHRIRAADDGRRAAVLHRAAGAQLLLGVDLRLPHRRSRRQSDLAARLHARQRLHHRRSTTWHAA